MKRILHLTLKKKWFDLIAKREKKIEYRKIKPYWCKRVYDSFPIVKFYDEIYFRNGYNKNSPFMRIEWKGVIIERYDGEKATEETYFGILLGDILEIRNWHGE